MFEIAKIKLDKYYTSDDLARYCVNKTIEIIGKDNISEYIEPSAGEGVFLKYLDKPFKAYDIAPESEDITKQDFLELDTEYKKGRCIIGNPPFGDSRNCLFLRFYKKSITLSDYISFILPISQYQNNIKLFEFDLIYSEDLGLREYSGQLLHCTFNIYKRPLGKFNNKPDYNLKDIKIKRHDRNSKEIYKSSFDYDLRICARGNSVGEICEYENQYAKEYCIKIHNEKLKSKIINLITKTKWKELIPNISTPYLPQYKILQYIKEQIPEIN